MVIRLKDIAKELGVSVPLVSKVLNNSQGTIGVSEKTAELIRSTAKRMGYVRNRSAASLTQGRQNAFGMMMQFAGVPGSRNTESILEGVSARARHYDQHLELDFYARHQELDSILGRLSNSSIDGLILAGVKCFLFEEMLQGVSGLGMPVVSIYTEPLNDTIPNINCDQKEMARLATSHLLQRGCRRVAAINMMDARDGGYRQALAEAGIDYDPALDYSISLESAIRFDRGIDAVEHFFNKGIEFDGLVTHCDLHAAGAIHALKDRGKSVPDDVKVVGMDNSLFCDGQIGITSVSENLRQQAEIAVDTLMEMISGKECSSRMVKPDLVVRQST